MPASSKQATTQTPYHPLAQILTFKKVKRFKGPHIYIPPQRQRFTMRSSVLTSISNRQRSAISDHPLPQRTDFGSLYLQSAARETHLCLSQPHYGWP